MTKSSISNLSPQAAFSSKVWLKRPFWRRSALGGPLVERKQEGGFVKGRCWRKHPHSFGVQEHQKSQHSSARVALQGQKFRYRGTSAATTLLETTLLRTPDLGSLLPTFKGVGYSTTTSGLPPPTTKNLLNLAFVSFS